MGVKGLRGDKIKKHMVDLFVYIRVLHWLFMWQGNTNSVLIFIRTQ